MRIAEINMIASGSTGKIMLNIASVARERGHSVSTFSTHVFTKKYKKLPKAPEGHSYYGCYLDHAMHFVLSNMFGKNGTHSKLSTACLIRKLKKFKPNVLHIHNLHDYCINFPMLVKYIKESGVKVYMTLHDCWAFTGHCAYYDAVGCQKWTTGCHDCSQLSRYPKERRDTSKIMYEKKKSWFNDIPNLTLITPSLWLKGEVEKSFLKEKEVFVINNGIDLSVFKPVESDFKKRHNIEDKFLVLGVADYWEERKGFDTFIKLSNSLDDRFRIVLVGTDEETEKLLPKNVIAVRRTSNQSELAEIYSSADVLVNPTREDNFPTVNMESLACGTPVVTFNTGGSAEIIDSTCGIAVDKGDEGGIINAVVSACENPFDKLCCISCAKKFDMNEKFNEYVNLFERESNK